MVINTNVSFIDLPDNGTNVIQNVVQPENYFFHFNKNTSCVSKYEFVEFFTLPIKNENKKNYVQFQMHQFGVIRRC